MKINVFICLGLMGVLGCMPISGMAQSRCSSYITQGPGVGLIPPGGQGKI